MEWFRNNKWWILIAIIIVTIIIGVTFFIFSPKKQSTENVVINPVPSVVTENKKIVEERAKLPIPPDVDPQAWPEKTILKTPQGLNRIIVHFKYGVTPEVMDTVIQKYGARVLLEFSSDPYSKSIFVPESQKDALSKDPAVYGTENDEPINMQQSQITPGGVTAVHATEAWGKGITGSSIKVCVIDSGVDMQNQDLIDHIGYSWSPPSFVTGIDDQLNGHGTHVAGTITANNNTSGVVGVAPGVDLCIIRVFDDDGNTTNSFLKEGFQKAIDQNARIINFSGGSQSEVSSVRAVIETALAKDIVVVAAAGNPDPGGLIYPGKQSGVISVSAVDNSGVKRSTYPDGSTITVVAPGISVLSDCPPDGSKCKFGSQDTVNRTASMNGTSMASPHVAGVVALLLSQPINAKYDVNKDNKWQPAEVTKILTDTATHLGSGTTGSSNDQYGYGMVNVQAALAAIAATFSCTTSPTWSSNATLCTGDDAGLTIDVNKTLVSACTTATKCEYTCKSGFTLTGGSCVAVVPPTSFSCTTSPTWSSNATLCTGDDAGLTIDVNKTLVSACTTATKCEYTCKSGFTLTGGSCVAATIPPPASVSSGGLIPCGRTIGTAAEQAPCTICHVVIGGNRIIEYGLQIMTVVAIAVMIAMGIFYIISAGNDEMMKTAKGGIKAALIGFAIMLGAWLIVNVTLTIFSASIPSLGITPGSISNGFSFTCDTSRP